MQIVEYVNIVKIALLLNWLKKKDKICFVYFSKGIQKGIANVTVRVVPVLEIQPQVITKPVGKLIRSFSSYGEGVGV